MGGLGSESDTATSNPALVMSAKMTMLPRLFVRLLGHAGEMIADLFLSILSADADGEFLVMNEQRLQRAHVLLA